jgi:hypothetical protein
MDCSEDDHKFAQQANALLLSMGQEAVRLKKEQVQRETEVNPFLMGILERWAEKNHINRSQAVDLAILSFLKEHTAIDSMTAEILGVDDEVVGMMQEDYE